MPKRPEDPRSTWRKRARQVLTAIGREYACECMGVPGCEHEGKCGFTPDEQNRSSTLDANHINKVLSDIRPDNLEWLCRGCHKRKDKQTDKGESIYEDEFGMQLIIMQAAAIREILGTRKYKIAEQTLVRLPEETSS